MSDVLSRYLAQAYRRDILGESVGVEMPTPSPELIARIKGKLAESDELARHLGASLPNRDFATFQKRRALLQLLKQLEVQIVQESFTDAPRADAD